MDKLSEWLDFLGLQLPTILVVLAIIGGWLLSRWAVQRAYRGKSGSRLSSQLIQLALGALTVLLLLISLPLPNGMRSELINLIGIVLSATIALSSTTFLSNAMAGMMLRAVRNFRAGDLIECGNHRGRVTERGLLHVEIQSEQSDLITLPNLFLVTNPVRVTTEAGTLISAEVSLGYDVPRSRIERRLLAAAIQVKLEEPFVWIQELGDFSVLYRVSGMLRPAAGVLSAHSRLRAAMLDSLHGAGIEIVSPTFMNQRRFPLEPPVIPPATLPAEEPESDKPPEEVVFSKAKQAALLAKLETELAALDAEIQEIDGSLSKLPDGPERNGAAARLERRRREREKQAAVLERRRSDVDNGK